VTVHRIGGDDECWLFRCAFCRRIVPIGPANDGTAPYVETWALEVACGERALLGGTSGPFRIGLHGDRDDYFELPNKFDEKTLAHCLDHYAAGAFCAHLIDEGVA
jgi:hypothetical protein